jgi:hypothetical protein
VKSKKDTIEEGRVSPEGYRKKSGDSTRKIEPLQGGLVQEMVRCGRSNCKCANGSLHGPYYYRVWMARRKRFKRYVRKDELSAVQAGINEHHRRVAEVRRMNQIARQHCLMLKVELLERKLLRKLAGYKG